MLLSARYKVFMTRLLAAASELFYAGNPVTAGPYNVGKKVNIEGTGLDGQQHIDDEKLKCYVQISEAVVEMGEQNQLLREFAMAHELGHLCMSQIGDQIGTSQLRLDSLKHEVAADLIGVCLLLKLGEVPVTIVSTLKSYGDFVMDEQRHGTHPARSERIGFIVALIIKVRIKLLSEVTAITQVLHDMGNV